MKNKQWVIIILMLKEMWLIYYLLMCNLFKVIHKIFLSKLFHVGSVFSEASSMSSLFTYNMTDIPYPS